MNQCWSRSLTHICSTSLILKRTTIYLFAPMYKRQWQETLSYAPSIFINIRLFNYKLKKDIDRCDMIDISSALEQLSHIHRSWWDGMCNRYIHRMSIVGTVDHDISRSLNRRNYSKIVRKFYKGVLGLVNYTNVELVKSLHGWLQRIYLCTQKILISCHLATSALLVLLTT